MFMLNLNLDIFLIVYHIEQWLIDLEKFFSGWYTGSEVFFLPQNKFLWFNTH